MKNNFIAFERVHRQKISISGVCGLGIIQSINRIALFHQRRISERQPFQRNRPGGLHLQHRHIVDHERFIQTRGMRGPVRQADANLLCVFHCMVGRQHGSLRSGEKTRAGGPPFGSRGQAGNRFDLLKVFGIKPQFPIGLFEVAANDTKVGNGLGVLAPGVGTRGHSKLRDRLGTLPGTEQQGSQRVMRLRPIETQVQRVAVGLNRRRAVFLQGVFESLAVPVLGGLRPSQGRQQKQAEPPQKSDPQWFHPVLPKKSASYCNSSGRPTKAGLSRLRTICLQQVPGALDIGHRFTYFRGKAGAPRGPKAAKITGSTKEVQLWNGWILEVLEDF